MTSANPRFSIIAATLATLTACGSDPETPSDGGGPSQPGSPSKDAGVDAVAHDGASPDASSHPDAAQDQDASTQVDASDASVSDWPPVAPLSNGVWVRVRNRCPFPIWIHGEGGGGTLQPDDTQLTTNASRDYKAPATWDAARVTAYVDGPRNGELEKAEMTFGGGTINYNVTYVDWVGLPLEIVGVGGTCDPAQSTTGCYAKESQILAGCPETFLRQGKKCVAARSYCLDPANQVAAYCHALDSAISGCSGCPGGATPDVYACSGPYSQNPRMCAALNRGMTQDPDSANEASYYQKPPFNTYAKWVHSVCPNIYAFPYDDWQAHGGFRACNGTEVRVTFCPSG